ncbi:MBL fold metallo-hydrolase [Pseudogracilibacillus auburnensis]|uniref:MBL fold metallo-hydrolase n=1 Tax=Pseudogracilibacillus auburnensis TaxID=1494959 RepID=UPI001A95F9D4|nr:MBL fold metallo-hydrolase [Pseudogracilibacillus auburnensis]MBO1003146.1 MBL fold metallo-hydrolase [Pseudogracilibacillus auburnensis]
MKVDILASGSSGNCIALTVDGKTILIDAGIAKTKIEKALLNVNIRPDQVEAIFITHAHKDHTKGLPLANKYQIPVYAGADEWKDIGSVDEGLRCRIFKNEGFYEPLMFDAGEIGIVPFKVHHDAYEPLGFVVSGGYKEISICLDTGHVDNEMLEAMKGSDVYIVEANHEPKMVERCDRPISVKTRILSDVGHLSNEQTADALCKLIQGKGEQIYLVHLSNDNNIPALAEATVNMALKKKGFQFDKDYFVEVI